MRNGRYWKMTGFNKFVIAGAIALSVVALPTIAYAASNTANTTITANIGSTISILSTGTVNLAITPVTGGAQTTASDTLLISTNNTTGYKLSLKDSDATTTLAKGSDSIAASTATPATPLALSNNSWGFRVDDAAVGGFGTGPTTAISSQPSSTVKYAGITASDTTIKTTATTTAGDTVYVWYSAKADTTKPNGAYADTVTYTATTNP